VLGLTVATPYHHRRQVALANQQALATLRAPPHTEACSLIVRGPMQPLKQLLQCLVHRHQFLRRFQLLLQQHRSAALGSLDKHMPSHQEKLSQEAHRYRLPLGSWKMPGVSTEPPNGVPHRVTRAAAPELRLVGMAASVHPQDIPRLQAQMGVPWQGFCC